MPVKSLLNDIEYVKQHISDIEEGMEYTEISYYEAIQKMQEELTQRQAQLKYLEESYTRVSNEHGE